MNVPADTSETNLLANSPEPQTAEAVLPIKEEDGNGWFPFLNICINLVDF